MYSLQIFHESENKTLSIFPKYPYLLAKGTKYLPIVKPCRPLSAGDHFLCNADHRALYHELTCIEQLMRFDDDPTHCTQHQVQIEEVKIQQSWILYSRLKTTLTKHCDNDVSELSIFGTYLVTIDEPCDLEINGIRISHRICIETDVVEPIPLVALPQLRVNASLSSARALNMNGVNQDEVKYMAYSLKHSSVIESVLNERKDFNFSENLGYVSLGLVILSFFAFIFYVFRLKLLNSLPCTKNYRNQSQIDRTDNFPLRDGGVMVSPRLSIRLFTLFCYISNTLRRIRLFTLFLLHLQYQ